MIAHGRTLLGLVALLLLLTGPAPGAAASDLERARIDRPSGIAPGLAAGGRRARVRIVAGAQPVLRAALGARLRTLLRPGRGSAKPFAGPAIDGGERARARR
ncbi:MAG TPA: hypothetical protein VFH44_05720, partial [Solirubrobacterales bacterium]|nr:hypothetical protein [Solirubrobacterales bacterium]